MENFEYDYDGIVLNIGYTTEDADPSVGLFGTQVFMHGICHKGEDIYELIGESTRNFLEERLMEYVNGWYSKRLIPRCLFLCYSIDSLCYPYRWSMKDLIQGLLVAIGIYILFFGAIHLVN